jgi:chaperonin GroEL (HSP60 family)
MEDIERAFDDAISTFRNVIRDNRFLPGAGATEIVNILFYNFVSIWLKS